MTTFEITTIVMLSVIAVAVVYGVCFIRNAWVVSTATLSNNIKGCKDKLADIEIDTVSIFQRLDSIHDDVVDDLRDNRILDKLKELDKPPFNILMDLPCYHPDGICTNPQMDCINCPKRGTGGIWSTSTNLNKEN